MNYFEVKLFFSAMTYIATQNVTVKLEDNADIRKNSNQFEHLRKIEITITR